MAAIVLNRLLHGVVAMSELNCGSTQLQDSLSHGQTCCRYYITMINVVALLSLYLVNACTFASSNYICSSNVTRMGSFRPNIEQNTS